MNDKNSLSIELKSNLIGRKITQMYCTNPSHHQELFDGQVTTAYFRCVMELNGTEKFDFGIDWFRTWNRKEELFTIEELDWKLPEGVQYRNKKIVDVRLDEIDHLFFLLENDVIVMAAMDLGNDIYISMRKEMFDKDWHYI